MSTNYLEEINEQEAKINKGFDELKIHRFDRVDRQKAIKAFDKVFQKLEECIDTINEQPDYNIDVDTPML